MDPDRHHPAAVGAALVRMMRRWPFIIALALGALAAAPLLLGPGFLNTRAGGDSPFLLFRLQQLHASLAEGVFPVRWMPDAAFGFGYPFFSYYAALPFYLAAVFKGFGFSFVVSLKLTQLAGFMLAAGAMYAWAHRHMRTRWAAILASAAYTFAPFHMVNVYVRGDSLSEFFAFAFYPLILLAADWLRERPTAPRVAYLALSYAGLLLTHNISAVIFTPFALLYLLCSAGVRPRRAVFLPLACALALGFLLAAWFWLPVLAEGDLAQLERSTTGYFRYSNHFRAGDLIQPSPAFNYAVDAQPTPFAMSLPQALLAVVGLAALILLAVRRGYPRPSFATFLIAGLVVSTFFITPASRLLWDGVPLLPLIQFPWRFLSVQALFTAALTGYIADVFPVGQGDRFVIRRLMLTASRMLPALVGVLLSGVLAGSALAALSLDFIPLTDDDITPDRLQLYEYFTGNIGTTIRYEWLPATVNPRPYSGPDLLGLPARVKPLMGEASGTRTARHAAWQQWAITVESQSATLALPTYYWPGWRASAGGRPVDLTAVPGLGWAQLTLPRGEYTVVLWLDRTPVRALGEVLSLVALAVVLVVLRRELRALAGAFVTHGRGAFASVFIAALVFFALRLFPERPLAGPLTMDFAQRAYLYHAPAGIDFGEGLRLLDYRITHTPDTCGSMTLETAWQGQMEGIAVAPALSLPAGNVLGFPVVVAEGEQSPLAAEATSALAPSCPLSLGVYLPTLSVEKEGRALPARTVSGQPRQTLTLAPVIQRERSIASADDQPIATLAPGLGLVEAELRPGNPNLIVRWRVDAELARNYHAGLRLRDVAGNLWAEQDAPLGLYGAYPTALWEPGELVLDAYQLPIPVGMPPGRDYRLRISVYDAATGESIGQAEVEGLAWTEPATAPPDAPRLFRPIPALSVSDLDVPDTVVQGHPFTVFVRWIAEAEPKADYSARWTLLSAGGEEVWSAQTPLAPGSPITLWREGSLVEGRLRLDPPAALPPGPYVLSLTLLDTEGEPLGDPLTVHQLALEPARVPTGEPADIPNRLEVDFGGIIRLWGYDATQTPEALTLTLTWGALTETPTDYTYFVHLFDPDSEYIAAQVDTMPHAFTHPTSTWIPDEIVTDTVSLSLAGVPPGAYRVAVGWYDVSGRLPARDAAGAPLDRDRALLPVRVSIPGR